MYFRQCVTHCVAMGYVIDCGIKCNYLCYRGLFQVSYELFLVSSIGSCNFIF